MTRMTRVALSAVLGAGVACVVLASCTGADPEYPYQLEIRNDCAEDITVVVTASKFELEDPSLLEDFKFELTPGDYASVPVSSRPTDAHAVVFDRGGAIWVVESVSLTRQNPKNTYTVDGSACPPE